MKACTASSVPAPKRSTNDAAKVASTPRGMTSSWLKWLARGWRAPACTRLTKARRLASVISAPHCEFSNALISLKARELPLLNRRQGTSRSRPTRSVESRRSLERVCLLYTSDAADEEDSVDLGGRRII